MEQLRLADGFRAADAVEDLAEPGIRGDDYKGRVRNLSFVVVIRRYGDPVGDWRREVARVGAGLAVLDAVFAAVPDSREIVLEVLEVSIPGVGDGGREEGSVNLGRRWAPGAVENRGRRARKGCAPVKRPVLVPLELVGD